MSKFITAAIIGLAAFILVRVIAGFFDIEPKALKVGRLIGKAPAELLWSTASALASIVTVFIVIAWLVLRADDRFRNWLEDRPGLASLAIHDQPTMRLEVLNAEQIRKVDLVVKLRNTNSKLIKYDAVLRATVNGQDLNAPAIVAGHLVPGDETPALIVTMRDVPMKKLNPKTFLVEATMRYDVRYRFEDGKNTRRTSKLVSWEATAPITGVHGTQTKIEIFTRFYDEIEE